MAFGESALKFEVWVFVRELANRLPVTHELQSHILQALRENRIEIPFPQQHVYLRGVAPEPGLDQDQRSTDTGANPSSAV